MEGVMKLLPAVVIRMGILDTTSKATNQFPYYWLNGWALSCEMRKKYKFIVISLLLDQKRIICRITINMKTLTVV